MDSLYSKRTELIAPTDDSFGAILILKELVCDDVGEYRCWIEYYSNKAIHVSTSLSTVAFEGIKYFIVPVCLNALELLVTGGKPVSQVFYLI